MPRGPDPIEIAADAVHLVAEAIVVSFALGVCALWLIILATPVPA